jgi:hypothetical protein
MILSKEKDAVLQFKNSCIKQGKALESGNYKEGNKSARYIYESIEFLKSNHQLDLLKPFLFEGNENLRIWSARALIHSYSSLCLRVLQDIANTSEGIHGLDAEMVISEYKKGNI